MKTVAITGHRVLSPQKIEVVHSAMHSLLKNDSVDRVLFGGAVGADSEALRACLFFRQKLGKQIQLVVVTPDTVDQQPVQVQVWIKQADEVIELKNLITSEDHYNSYHIRNRYLVENAEIVIAFFNGQYNSGTGHAMRHAKLLGKKLAIIPV